MSNHPADLLTMSQAEWFDAMTIGGTQVELVARCGRLARELDAQRRRNGELTEERDSARLGLFSHLTGEHALAEPTYQQLTSALANLGDGLHAWIVDVESRSCRFCLHAPGEQHAYECEMLKISALIGGPRRSTGDK